MVEIALYTQGPYTYKIPGFADIPQVFNARLPKGVKCTTLSIQSSKGIGEPPLFLAASVLFALREAVKAARESVAVDARAMCWIVAYRAWGYASMRICRFALCG